MSWPLGYDIPTIFWSLLINAVDQGLLLGSLLKMQEDRKILLLLRQVCKEMYNTERFGGKQVLPFDEIETSLSQTKLSIFLFLFWLRAV